MKALLRRILKRGKITGEKTLMQYKQEALMKQGREQFEKLVKGGLQIPVALVG